MSALGPVFSAGLAGLMLGAFVTGPIADRYGRKPVLIGCALSFGIMTFACAAATSLQWLIMGRLLAGFGLGGAMPKLAYLWEPRINGKTYTYYRRGLRTPLPRGDTPEFLLAYHTAHEATEAAQCNTPSTPSALAGSMAALTNPPRSGAAWRRRPARIMTRPSRR